MKKTAIIATIAAGLGLLAGSAADRKLMNQGIFWMHDDDTAIVHDENGVSFYSWDPINDTPVTRGFLQVNPGEGMALVFYDENGENPLIINRQVFLNLATLVVENKIKLNEDNDRPANPLNDA